MDRQRLKRGGDEKPVCRLDDDRIDEDICIGGIYMQSLSKNWIAASYDYRRKYERKDYSTDIVFAADNRVYRGGLKNISVGGAFIMTKDVNQLYEGDLVSLSIPFTNGYKHVKRKGHVLWKNAIGFAVGFI
jgi:hypothetical protein